MPRQFPGRSGRPAAATSSGDTRPTRSSAGITCRACKASTTARSRRTATASSACFALEKRTPLPAPARRLERRRPRLAHRAGADRFRHRRSGVGRRLRLRSARRARSTARTTSPGAAGTTGRRSALRRRATFRTFERLENAFLPFNRNGVLFPRKIGGKYFMLSRPSDDGHTPFGDIYLSQSPDMCHWGMHRLVMRRGGDEVGQWWQRTKIGAGPIPIETDDGWLMIYHGVMDTCNGFVYSMGAALLDLDEPWRVLYRTNQHILTPEAGLRSVRPRAERRVSRARRLCDEAADRLAVYYGAADTSCCVAYARSGRADRVRQRELARVLDRAFERRCSPSSVAGVAAVSLTIPSMLAVLAVYFAATHC